MKKLSMILSVMFFAFGLSGQSQWVYDGWFNFPFKFHQTKNNDYILLHGVDAEHLEILTILDSMGNVLNNLESSHDFGGNLDISLFTDIIELPDTTIAVLAKSILYDSLTMEYYHRNSLLKFDKDWQPTQIDMVDSDGDYDGIALNDGSYVLLNQYGYHIRKLNGNGEFVLGNDISGYDCYELAHTTTDSILLATAQALLVLDTACNIVHTFPSYKFRRLKTNEQDRVMGVRDDSLFLLSPGHSLLASLGYQGKNIKDFAFQGDTIAVLTADDSVHLYQGNLSPLGSFQLVDEAYFGFIAFQSPSSLMLCGSERYGGTTVLDGIQASFLKEYSLDGDDFGLDNDLGVVQVSQWTEASIQHITGIPLPNSSYYKVTFEGIKATVKNFGNHAIDSLDVRTRSNVRKFNNLNLQPGEERELDMGDIVQGFESYPSGTTLNLCFFTTHPDGRLDSDAENDSYCTSFLVNDDEVLPSNHLSIYPNPTTDYLNFELHTPQPLQKAQFRVYDASGKLVRDFASDSPRDTFILPVWDWPSGSYFLQYLQGGEVRAVEQFVVQKK